MCPNLSSNVVEWTLLSEYDATFFLRKEAFCAKKNYSRQNKILRLIFLGTVFLFSAKGTNLTTGQRSVVGDSLRCSGETWCVRGSYDGMHDEASLI